MTGIENPLDVAVHQFNLVAESINLDPAIHKRLSKPARCYIVSVPVRMDDGRIEVFEGYRVHHNTSRGPAKGGIRYHPEASLEETIARGELAYEYFCVQCHGSKYNGDGTVGQSFAPLPTDLKSAYIQQMSDDELFRSISYGMMRHPPMWYTVSARDRWALIHWIQSLGVRGEEDSVIPSGDYQRSVNAIP